MPTRINKFVAQSSGLSRRSADSAIQEGRVTLNGKAARLGDSVEPADKVLLDGRPITPAVNTITIMLNKPAGYVVSREGQGSQTIYDLLPEEYRQLQPVGRLDKYSSGLLLLTNDGGLANELTHPRYAKTKIYEIQLDKPLATLDHKMINGHGIQLEDGLSKLALQKLDGQGKEWMVIMSEGRNRQIRRTFLALGYKVVKLHRTHFGDYQLDHLAKGQFKAV